MFVSLDGVWSGSHLEQQLLNAFVEAGAHRYEGRSEEYEHSLVSAYSYLGWGVGKGTYFSHDENRYFLEQFSVDFILNGTKPPQKPYKTL